jgi:hypothetical protein
MERSSVELLESPRGDTMKIRQSMRGFHDCQRRGRLRR